MLMRYPFLFLTSLLLFCVGSAVSAADPYANAVQNVSLSVYQPANALGGPDDVYADFFNANANITLDMGEMEAGDGYFTMYYQLLQYGSRYNVIFYNEDFEFLTSSGDYFPVSGSSITIPYETGVPYRYVKIENNATSAWKLDAVETSHIFVEEPTPEPVPEQIPEPVPEVPPTVELDIPLPGTLVKLADDGDASTTYDSAVYIVGSDKKRHAFPSATIFFTWFEDFSGLTILSKEELANLPLGKNVPVRPGTHLVKITTDPKVYAVEPHGVLRWITTEQIAQELFGLSWQTRVIDIPDVFFGNYQAGDPITAPVHPDGSIVEHPQQPGSISYIENAIKRTLSVEAKQTLRIQDTFIIPSPSSAIFDAYIDGGMYQTESSDALFPY